jgi:glucose/arabinose dehydrogenase
VDGRGGTSAAIRIHDNKGKHPELKEKVIVPDVPLQPHNASLEMTFYQGKQFPAEYQGRHFCFGARIVESISPHGI